MSVHIDSGQQLVSSTPTLDLNTLDLCTLYEIETIAKPLGLLHVDGLESFKEQKEGDDAISRALDSLTDTERSTLPIYVLEKLILLRSPYQLLTFSCKLSEGKRLDFSRFKVPVRELDAIIESVGEDDAKLSSLEFRLPIFQALWPSFKWMGGLEAKLRRDSSAIDSVTDKMNSICSSGFLSAFQSFVFSFKNVHLSPGMGSLEPLWIESFLFNETEGEKCSESFWMFQDPLDMTKKIGKSYGCSEDLKHSRNCIFTFLKTKKSRISLIFRIYRILQGDPKSAIEKYYSERADSATKESQAESQALFSRFFRFKQLIAWSYVLLEDKVDLALHNVACDLFAPMSLNGYHETKQILDALRDRRFLKQLPGQIAFCISQSIESLPLVDRYPDTKSVGEHNLREVLYLPLHKAPWLMDRLLNFSFIYPQSVSFSDARSVSILVKVKDSDSSAHDDGLPLIFGSPPHEIMQTRTFTSAYFNVKQPRFLDEIKVSIL
jgi:hypothetical protein